jgi:hypothetical protein
MEWQHLGDIQFAVQHAMRSFGQPFFYGSAYHGMLEYMAYQKCKNL